MTSQLSSAVVAATEASGGEHLPMPPIAYAAITFTVFMFLLALLWSFRNVASSETPKKGQAHGHAAHGEDHEPGSGH
ncbi:hypothetical protein ACMYYO_09745 [Dermacoccaceae bacterium W4C1]